MNEKLLTAIKMKEARVELKTKLLEAVKEELKTIVNSNDTYRIATFAGQYLEDVKRYNDEIQRMNEEIMELKFIMEVE